MTEAVAIVHPRGGKRKAARGVPQVVIPKRRKTEEAPAPSTSRRSRYKSESESSEDEQDEIVDDSGSSDVIEVPSRGKGKAPAKSTEGRKARKPTADEASGPSASWFDTPAGQQALERALAKRLAEEGPSKSKKASGTKSSKK
jgi:hypothetical protein